MFSLGRFPPVSSYCWPGGVFRPPLARLEVRDLWPFVLDSGREADICAKRIVGVDMIVCFATERHASDMFAHVVLFGFVCVCFWSGGICDLI